MPTTKRPPFMIHKDIRINDWIEIKYNGRTYLVALSTLLSAYDKQDEIERLSGDLEIARLQRDAKLSSQTAVDEAQAREIERLKAHINAQAEYHMKSAKRMTVENERLRAELEEIERNTDPDNGELMPWSYLQVNAAARKALQGESDE